MAEIDTLNIGGIDYSIKDSVARSSSGAANLIAYTENGTTASQAYSVIGTPINWKGTLYYTKTAVAKGATWAVNTNLTAANNLGRLTRNIKTYVGSDGKLHFTDLTGADTVLNFKADGTVIPRGKSIRLAPSANGVVYEYENIPSLNTIGWKEASQYQGMHLCNPKDFKTIYIRWWKVIGFKNSDGSFTTIANVANNQWQTITVPDNTYDFLIISAYNNSLQEFKRTAQY